MTDRPVRVDEWLRVGGRLGALACDVTFTALAYDLQAASGPPEERRWYLGWQRRRFCRATLERFGVRWTLEPPPSWPCGGRVVVANHRSALDILVLVAGFGGTVLSRADVADWPLFGGLARRAGTVFVERGDRRSGMRAVRAMRRALSEGETLIVFPEGGTFSGDEVRPFRRGAFVAAAGLDVEIVPVGIAHDPSLEYVDVSFGQHLLGVASARRTRIVAHVGAPMRVGPDITPEEVAEQARREVQRLVEAARRRWDETRDDAPADR